MKQGLLDVYDLYLYNFIYKQKKNILFYVFSVKILNKDKGFN